MYTEIIEKAPEVSEILASLGNSKRLCLLCILSDGPKNISEITQSLHISQSLASQFALKMRDQGILTSHKIWKEVFYEIADSKTGKLLKALKDIYCSL